MDPTSRLCPCRCTPVSDAEFAKQCGRVHKRLMRFERGADARSVRAKELVARSSINKEGMPWWGVLLLCLVTMLWTLCGVWAYPESTPTPRLDDEELHACTVIMNVQPHLLQWSITVPRPNSSDWHGMVHSAGTPLATASQCIVCVDTVTGNWTHVYPILMSQRWACNLGVDWNASERRIAWMVLCALWWSPPWMMLVFFAVVYVKLYCMQRIWLRDATRFVDYDTAAPV
jgi:hypothetical protein